jgi:DNA-binding transcriptional LysR family regulator
MNIDHLKAFHRVALTGSFTKAAKSLYLTQPAVSQQVQLLENSLGIKLFDRQKKRVRLTDEGEVLLSYTDKLFNLYDEILNLFQSQQKLERGKIAIGSTNVMGTYYLPRAMGIYNSLYPGIEIELRLGNSDYVIDRTIDGDIELGVAGKTKTHPRLSDVLIHQERLLLVCSPKNELSSKTMRTVGDLVKTPFIWREKGTTNRMVVEKWFRDNFGKDYPRVSVELENVEAAKRIVEQGYGITIIPEATVKREIETGILKQINMEGLDLHLSIYLFYLKGRVFSHAVRAFLKTISEMSLFSNSESLDGII